MESKGQGAHFSQEKEGESVTLKVRFAQFKETVGPSSSDGSGGSCLKWFNFVLSVILLVVGLACIIMGIICHVKYYSHFEYIGKGYVNVITIFIVAGVVMVIAGALGIFCIWRKSYSSLMACLIILAVLIILHFILGGLAFSFRSRADRLTKEALFKGYKKYSQNEHALKFMDWSQHKFKCCGLNGPTDYTGKTHPSTKAPETSTRHVETTTVPATTTTSAKTTNATVAPTTKGNTTATTALPTTSIKTTTAAPNTTTALPNTTTSAATTTTKAASTTTAAPTNTTAAPTTTTAAPTTTTAAPTTTTAAPTTTTAAPTTTTAAPTTTTAAPTTTTAAPTTTTAAPTTTTAAPTTTTAAPSTTKPRILFDIPGNLLELKGEELPASCCKEDEDVCQPHDAFERGCYIELDSFLKAIMCAVGTVSFVMIAFELLHLITGALCSKRLKEEASYSKF